MTLRYLATGSILLTAADFAGVSKTSAFRYIHQVCRAIAKQRPKFVSFPSTVAHTRRVVKGFYDRSKFPRVIGAVDCSHIRIQGPGMQKIICISTAIFRLINYFIRQFCRWG